MEQNILWSRAKVIGLLALTGVIFGVTPASAALLYSQPLQIGPTVEGQFSNTGGQVVADEFTLSGNATVTGLSWWGFYNGTDLSPSVSNMDFNIQFLTDGGGLPSSAAFADVIVNASVSNSGYMVELPGPHMGSTIYEFSVVLPSAVSIAASSITWLSVFEADLSTPDIGSTQWLWSASPSLFVDSSAHRNNLFPNGWTPYGGPYANLAFELRGNFAGIPEPASLTLVSLGLLILGLEIKRKAMA